MMVKPRQRTNVGVIRQVHFSSMTFPEFRSATYFLVTTSQQGGRCSAATMNRAIQILALASIVLFPAQALAHARLDHASPKVGIPRPRRRVKWCMVHRETEPAFSTIEVRGADGSLVSIARPRVEAGMITCRAQGDWSGTYKVLWAFYRGHPSHAGDSAFASDLEILFDPLILARGIQPGRNRAGRRHGAFLALVADVPAAPPTDVAGRGALAIAVYRASPGWLAIR